MLTAVRYRRVLGALASAANIALFVVLLVLASPALASRVALVVGNSAYSNAPTLSNPSNDASAIGEKLSGIGFDVEIVLDASLSTLRAELDAFAERAGDAETALIFYAGHGMQVGGENYLLPTDIVLRERSDLADSAVGVTEVFEAFNSAAPEAAVLILDACRDNPFADAVGGGPGLASGTVSPRRIASRPNSAGMVIAFSAAPGAVAYDGASGNSPYTTALLKWIDRPGMELATMLRRVRGTVLQLTDGAQVPWVEEALVRDVYLNPGPPGTARSEEGRIEAALLERIRGLESETEQQAGRAYYDNYLVEAPLGDEAVRADDEGFVREALIWLSIRQSGNPEIFRAYLEEFPDGSFTELARAKMQAAATGPEPEALAWLDTLPSVSPGQSAQSPEVSVASSSRPNLPQAAPRTEAAAGSSQSGVERPEALPPSPSEIEAGLDFNTSELAAIQRLLAGVGVYSGPIDADYGAGTRSGIERFQTGAELPATGYLDIPTLRALVARAAPPLLRSGTPPKIETDLHRVAAVAARGPGAETQTVRVEAIARNDTVHAYWRDVADEFEATHPGTRIEINTRPGVRYRTELMALLGSETPPDILYTWSGGHLDALRDAGFARDLTEEMGDGWAFDFKPGALRTYTHDGRVHGVPMHLSLVSLYANRAVFERAGVPLSQVRTWQGFLDAVRAFKAQGIVSVAIGGGDRWPFNLYFGELAQRLGGKETFEAALAGDEPGFDGPVFLQAGTEFDRFAELDPFQPGFLDMNDGEAVDIFARGEAAMVVTGNWRLQKMRWSWPGGPERMAEDLAQLPFPAIGDRPQDTLTHGGADGFAVSADAPDIAVDFLRHLTGREVQERMAEIASDVPSLSSADLSIERGFLEDAADKLLTSTYHQIYYDQALGPEAGGVLTDAMVNLATGAIEPEAAVGSLDAAWDQVLAGRGKR